MTRKEYNQIKNDPLWLGWVDFYEKVPGLYTYGEGFQQLISVVPFEALSKVIATLVVVKWHPARTKGRRGRGFCAFCLSVYALRGCTECYLESIGEKCSRRESIYCRWSSWAYVDTQLGRSKRQRLADEMFKLLYRHWEEEMQK